jgi:hypothetical protein
MVTLSIASDYLALLIAQTRGVQARVGVTDPLPGSNPTDDRAVGAIQDGRGDLAREEIRQEIRGLDDRQQAELVALLWVGRGHVEPQDWASTVAMAQERRDRPTEDYLLGDPLVAEFWAEGAERLGVDLPIEDIDELH